MKGRDKNPMNSRQRNPKIHLSLFEVSTQSRVEPVECLSCLCSLFTAFPELANSNSYFDVCRFSVCAPTSFIVELINRRHRFFILKHPSESRDIFDESGCVVSNTEEIVYSIKENIDFSKLQSLYDDYENQVENARAVFSANDE